MSEITKMSEMSEMSETSIKSDSQNVTEPKCQKIKMSDKMFQILDSFLLKILKCLTEMSVK